MERTSDPLNLYFLNRPKSNAKPTKSRTPSESRGIHIIGYVFAILSASVHEQHSMKVIIHLKGGFYVFYIKVVGIQAILK